MLTQSISPERLLQSSFAAVGRVYASVLLLSLPSLLQTFLTSLAPPGLVTVIINLVFAILIFPWFTGALIFYLYHNLVQDRGSVTITESLQLASTKLVQLILCQILLVLILLPAFLLLIIPGIYVSVRLAFSLYGVTIENLSATEAISRSWQLVKGRWWAVFLALLVVTLPFILVGGIIGVVLGAAKANAMARLVGGIFGFLIAPILSVYYIFLYRGLQVHDE